MLKFWGKKRDLDTTAMAQRCFWESGPCQAVIEPEALVPALLDWLSPMAAGFEVTLPSVEVLACLWQCSEFEAFYALKVLEGHGVRVLMGDSSTSSVLLCKQA
jgi:hypothetical protein